MAIAATHSIGKTKRVAVMQPYLFPYFPYIQLLSCVDVFVIFDTAQFIGRGWAHRNLIKLDGGQHRFVLPVRKAARDTPFSNIVFAENIDSELIQLRQTLHHANRTSPVPTAPRRLLDATFPLAKSAATSFVDAFERMSLCLMETLSFRTTLVRASEIGPRENLPAEEYIIQLVKAVGGSEYVNPIGGTDLYEKEEFAARGLQLSFLQSRSVTEKTQDDSAGLEFSILHTLAHHEPADLHRRLGDFALVSGEATSDAKSLEH